MESDSKTRREKVRVDSIFMEKNLALSAARPAYKKEANFEDEKGKEAVFMEFCFHGRASGRVLKY